MEATVFNLIKQYGSDFIYDLNRDQLKLDLLSGHIRLKEINIKPQKINEMLDDMGLPFSLKAGMFTNFNCKLSSLSLIHEFTTKKLSSKKLQSSKASIEIVADEILIVLGSSRDLVSTDRDFEWDNDPTRSYISIEDERRRLKKKKKNPEERKEEPKHSKALPNTTQTTSPESIKMILEMFMNLISINVSKIHVRFEDDFYSHYEGSYAFGVTMNSLNINSTDKEVEFSSPLDMNYQEIYPENDKNLFLKHILFQNI